MRWYFGISCEYAVPKHPENPKFLKPNGFKHPLPESGILAEARKWWFSNTIIPPFKKELIFWETGILWSEQVEKMSFCIFWEQGVINVGLSKHFFSSLFFIREMQYLVYH